MEIKLIYKQGILREEWSGDGARTSNVLLLTNRRGLSFSFDSMVHIETYGRMTTKRTQGKHVKL